MKKVLAITTVAAVMLWGSQSALAFSPRPMPMPMPQSGDDVTVSNTNSGTIHISASAKALSGGNQANGGDTDDAGSGGSVNNSDDANMAGDGGRTGGAGSGGSITTGMAQAWTMVDTNANKSDTAVRGGEDVTVLNTNHLDLVIRALSDAKSGGNQANGGDAGSAGSGGSVNSSDDRNSAGDGGRSGNAGNGGMVDAGDAVAWTDVITDANESITRVVDDCDECDRGFDPFMWFWGSDRGDTVRIINTNSLALTIEEAGSKAVSGNNKANGGDTGDAGNGGSVNNSDDANMAGSGGNTGNAGDGGEVTTGTAQAWIVVESHFNRSDTIVRDDCDACDDEGDDVTVRNRNIRLDVNIDADSEAVSTGNHANGGDTGAAGDGGSVNNSSGSSRMWFWHQDDGNTAGAGGSTGSAGDGGVVVTGLADAYTKVLTVEGREIVRIRY